MNPDIMQKLAMLLSGTQMQAPAQQPVAPQPMQQQPAPSMQATLIPTRPGDTPELPKPKPGDGGGKGGGHRPLTKTQKQETRAALRGPSAYTPAMRTNIGMGAVTPGYGNQAPQPSGFTKFIELFTPPQGVI